MPSISPKIHFYDKEKIKNINPETLKLWQKYEVDMSLRELSLETVKGYRNDCQHWFIYILDNQFNQCVTALNEDDITDFLYFCKTQGNNSRRMKRRMSSIAAFYKFLRKKRLITESPMEFIDRPKKDVDIAVQTFLTAEQVGLMREKLIEHGNLDLQVYALFSLSTMARVTAVAHITWEQVDFEARTCNDVLEKEGKYVTLYFNEEVKDLLLKLQQYRADKNIDDSGYVFYCRQKDSEEPVNTGTLNQWCKKIGQMIGVSTLHPHDFRHSGAQLLKLSGMPIEEISELLNHASLDVTKKFYLRQDKAKLQANKDKYKV